MFRYWFGLTADPTPESAIVARSVRSILKHGYVETTGVEQALLYPLSSLLNSIFRTVQPCCQDSLGGLGKDVHGIDGGTLCDLGETFDHLRRMFGHQVGY